MSALVASELLKLRTTRSWIGYTLVIVLFAAVSSAGQIGTAERIELVTSEDLLTNSLLAGLIALLVGIVSVTAEWRHGTITRTFLVTPRRGRVLLAKGATIALVAALLALLAISVVLAVAVPWLAVEGSSFDVDGGVLDALVRIVLAAVLWGALGVAVGAAVQSQTPALLGAILWIFLGEALVGALFGLVDVDDAADYLPGAALGAFERDIDDGLSPWVGAGVGCGWIVLLGALGALRTARRDIT